MNNEKIDKIKEMSNLELWLKHSFLAFILSRLKVEFVDSEHQAPAFTNGKEISINYGWIMKDPLFKEMKPKNYVFLLAHELLHILNFTTERRGTRDPELWNIAADYVINASLIHNRKADGTANPIGEMPQSDSMITPDNPKGYMGLYDQKYLNKTIEQVYDELLQEQEQKGQGGCSYTLADENDETGKPIVLDIQLDQNCPKSTTDSDMTAEIKAIIQNALSELSLSKTGVDSAYSRGVVDILKPPPFDWKGALSRYITSLIKSDTSWKRLSRRTWGCGYPLPSQSTTPKIELGIAIDTSGSIGDKEIKTFLSHIAKIMSSFVNFKIDLWCFSTEVHEQTLKSFTKSNVGNLIEYQSFSKGGTDIASNFDFIAEKRKKYNVFICFTDGYDNLDNLQFSGCPTIWGIVDNPNFVKPVGVKQATVIPIEF